MTQTKNGIHRDNGTLSARDGLTSLPFADFARRVAAVLTTMGYEDVRVMGRAAGGGRNGAGGYDLECFLRDGAVRRKVIVLLKQFGPHAWVYQRMVDELRGVALRDGADEALLITSGPISGIVEQCEGPGLILPRVRRIDGERLRRLLAANGVKKSKEPMKGRGGSFPSPEAPPQPTPSTGNGSGRRTAYRWALGGGTAGYGGGASVTLTLTIRTIPTH